MNGLTLPGAEVVGKGMVHGAVKTSELIFHGADYAKKYITPEAPRPVDSRYSVLTLEYSCKRVHRTCKKNSFLS